MKIKIRCELILYAYIIYYYFTHLYYSRFIVFTQGNFLVKSYLIIALGCCFISIFKKNTYLLFLNLIFWGSLYKLNPYVVYISYSITTISLCYIFINSVDSISEKEKFLINYSLKMLVVFQYVIIAYQKIINPFWQNGVSLEHLIRNEPGTGLFALVFQYTPVSVRLLSLSAIAIELFSVGILFKKTKMVSLWKMISFHLILAIFFKIYFISLPYIIYYFLIDEIDQKNSVTFEKFTASARIF